MAQVQAVPVRHENVEFTNFAFIGVEGVKMLKKNENQSSNMSHTQK